MGELAIRELRQELAALFAKAKLPTSPVLASRILDLIGNPRASAVDFGRAIRVDAALTSRLLKAANSVQFAQRLPVTTVERAVIVVGLQRVKMISLGFQLVGHLDRLGNAPFDIKTFWQHSLLRGCVARVIAESVVARRREEAFLIGLMQDCGILLLVQLLGPAYARLYRSSLSPTAFHTMEKETFDITHVDAIAAMAVEWELPRIIKLPLEKHHDRPNLGNDPTEADLLLAVIYFVGGLCFRGDPTVDPMEQDLIEFGRVALGMDDAAWAAARQQALDEYHRIATVYADVLPDDVDVAELLCEANRHLTAAAEDGDQRVLNVQEERDQIHQEQERLAHALSEYRERAALDPLTNVLNRGGLAEAARQAIESNRDQGVPIGVLFLDLDNFKLLNDSYGHTVGDGVLKTVAALLAKEAGPAATVGRYGGEEFVVLLKGLDADTSRRAAEDLVRKVRAIDTTDLGLSSPITCSLGGVWCRKIDGGAAEDLFARADEMMYRAKRGGKDRASFRIIEHAKGPARRTSARNANEHDSTAVPPPDATDRNAEALRLFTLAAGLNEQDTKLFAGIRKQERKPLIMACVLHCFAGAGDELNSQAAASRNISTGGIGVLVPRALVRGEPVEIELDKGSSKLFLAGLVSFCRRIEDSIHEVGVQFVSQSVSPIISGDLPHALRQHEWIVKALTAKRQGKLQPQPSA